MRKHYSATFKADAIKDLMKEEKTISQLAAELGIHPTQLKEWKKIALQGLPDLLSLSRSSLYYQPVSPSSAEVALKHRIDAIYTAYPFYGSRRITVQLRREGKFINRKAVQRRMREMGIAGIYPG